MFDIYFNLKHYSVYMFFTCLLLINYFPILLLPGSFAGSFLIINSLYVGVSTTYYGSLAKFPTLGAISAWEELESSVQVTTLPGHQPSVWPQGHSCYSRAVAELFTHHACLFSHRAACLLQRCLSALGYTQSWLLRVPRAT